MNQMSGNIACMLLCGGKGTRMQSQDTHKVCFSINGRPAIHQSIDRYREAGLDHFVVVVGAMAGQVVSCVGSHYEGISFAYQKEAKGTGDAARTGWNCLKHGGHLGPILITMGDKIVDPSVIRSLTQQYEATQADLVFTVQPQSYNVSGGHIVVDQTNRIRGICEDLDVKMAQLFYRFYRQYPLNSGSFASMQNQLLAAVRNVITSERKRIRAESQVMAIVAEMTAHPDKAKDILKRKSFLLLGSDLFEPDLVAQAPYVNAAIYLINPIAFSHALPAMSQDNAAQEEYLTDLVNAICNEMDGDDFRFKVSILPVDDQKQILTYNNVDELLDVERILSGDDQTETGLSFNRCKPVAEWIRLFTNLPESLLSVLHDIYGDDPHLIKERQETYLTVLQRFSEQYGSSRRVVIARSPGRVNLMGRHIEHRGGNINVISINKEVITVASLADDPRLVRMTNTNPDFPDRFFDIAAHFETVNWDSWLNFLDSDEIKKMVTDSQGDWMNYVKAPILRLQYLYRDKKLLGMDMAFTGNIPVAAGLSSSSAIVVASAEAAVALNQLDVTPQSFVDLCGEGEWFVGSRGGAGDHAAMKFGVRGTVTSLGFYPFGPRGSFAFPDGYRLLIANSYVKANKTTNAKDTFNQRVASYEFAVMLIKDRHPEYATLIQHLRDINSETLGVKPSVIYELLLELPEYLTQEELFTCILPIHHDKIRRIISSHRKPDKYLIRSVALYGLSEIRRAAICQELMKNRQYENFGELMQISHDGDRVVRFDGSRFTPYDYSCPDERLDLLIDDLRSEDPHRVSRSQLERIPGGYACSTEEVDQIVDTVSHMPGVVGAQLSGAGLGGCVMILVRDEAVQDVIKHLMDTYYGPRNLENGITVCIPVKGSGIISI